MLKPCFWYDQRARDAFNLYSDCLPNAEITMDNGFLFELTCGRSVLVGMNGGPAFRPGKTLSVFAELPSVEAVDQAYKALTAEGSNIYMEKASNPWSPAYAWIADPWGVNWQLMCVPDCEPSLSTALMFTSDQAGNAQPAIDFYSTVFAKAEVLTQTPYPETMGADAGKVMHAQLGVGETKIILNDSSAAHNDAFSEGGSIMVTCDTQNEIDHYWKALTKGGGKSGRCGWLKDRFGVSWQIIPAQLGTWMSNPMHAAKVGERLQLMEKLIIEDLRPKGNRGGLAEQLAKVK